MPKINITTGKQAIGLIKELASNGTITITGKGNEQKIAYGKTNDKGKIVYPSETARETMQALLGASYLVKDEAGGLLVNYNVILEVFTENDNSIDMTQFVDLRSGERNSTTIFQTDSIVASKNHETNSFSDSNDENSKTRKKKVREIKVILNKEYGTQTTEINTRDTSSVVAMDLQASDMEQHGRMTKLQKNRFILGLFMDGSTIIDHGVEFNESAQDIDAEYIKLGKYIYPIIKNEIQNFKEFMTIYRPGGFVKQDLFLLGSPKAVRACVDYQTSLPSSDKAFQVAAEGELYNYSIEGIPVHETNLLKGGQKLVVEDHNGDMITEYFNDQNIEFIIGIKNYTKYVQADPYVNVSPMVVNGQIVAHIIGQYTEGMHNGVNILEDAYIGIAFKRTTAEPAKPAATISNVEITDETAADADDGTAKFSIVFKDTPTPKYAVMLGSDEVVAATDYTAEVNLTGLSDGSYTIKALDGDTEINTKAFTITAGAVSQSAGTNEDGTPKISF